ncbi:MAG: hypothetical protein KQH63_07625 [Desulfobulbaceae bacterium]|nr:hypothetical protein [Desulfobulbaceae bacterium]
MPKEKVKKMTGVLASVFAHTGHINKKDAQEISGLDDDNFEKAYSKASEIAKEAMEEKGDKMQKLMERLAAVINEESADLGGVFK